MVRWNIYRLELDNGKFTFSHVRGLHSRWPYAFPEIARTLGYTRMVCDKTIVGQYAVDQEGNCLVCVSEGHTPEAIYG